jgi:hypothetical protein
MNLIIFISILSLAVLVFALLKLNRQRPSIDHQQIRSNRSEIRHFDGLFAERNAEYARSLERADETRERLLQRAAEGDLPVLDDAHRQADLVLYHEVLQRLVEQTNGDAVRLRAIAEYIVASKVLRSSAGLAQAVRERCGNSIDKRSLHYMFYLSALSDDAGAFLKAVETVLEQWRLGRLKSISDDDFLAIVESSYWLIASEVRSSGSGFVLKEAIAGVRRELAAANRRSS